MSGRPTSIPTQFRWADPSQVWTRDFVPDPVPTWYLSVYRTVLDIPLWCSCFRFRISSCGAQVLPLTKSNRIRILFLGLPLDQDNFEKADKLLKLDHFRRHDITHPHSLKSSRYWFINRVWQSKFDAIVSFWRTLVCFKYNSLKFTQDAPYSSLRLEVKGIPCCQF
jgi:hypothetical protein